jgi:hypothetical protein
VVAKGGSEPLRFRGTPGSLSAALPRDEPTPRRFPVRVALTSEKKKKGAEPIVTRASRVENDLVLQMALPARTPPGTYEGTIEVEGEQRAVVIEVEPEIELQIVPDQLTLRAAPGDRVAVSLTIANAGNVAVDLRRAYAFGVFAAGGLERALHRTYVDERPEGERRVDYLFDRLAEEHGGVVRVAVEAGAGSLEPGEARDVRMNFHVPERLARGRTYSGTLPVHDLRYYVRLVLAEANEPEPPR